MEAVIVALIAAGGGVIAALVQKGRRENREDHNVVANMLITVKDDIIHLHHKIDHVDDQLTKVEDKIDDHVQSHRRKKIILVLKHEVKKWQRKCQKVERACPLLIPPQVPVRQKWVRDQLKIPREKTLRRRAQVRPSLLLPPVK
jgi:hypothetical protein